MHNIVKEKKKKKEKKTSADENVGCTSTDAPSLSFHPLHPLKILTCPFSPPKENACGGPMCRRCPDLIVGVGIFLLDWALGLGILVDHAFPQIPELVRPGVPQVLIVVQHCFILAIGRAKVLRPEGLVGGVFPLQLLSSAAGATCHFGVEPYLEPVVLAVPLPPKNNFCQLLRSRIGVNCEKKEVLGERCELTHLQEPSSGR